MGKKLATAVTVLLMMMFVNCSRDKVKTAEGYWDLGRESFNNKKYVESIAHYQKLVKRFPQDTLAIRALFSVAEIYKNNLQDFSKSIESYNQILEKYSEDPKTPNASFMIGYIYANDLNDYESAKTSYEKFIKIYPDHMLVPSAQWEIENLGKSLDEIPQMQTITKGQ
ncbi:tetratricopeptide repeat protein [bacterium]|nr:tetratricopeptide repeat protein [bacterium]MBU1635920.1 tetratricopeptide repeat protein [bacterium]MBU1874077.1 tetratricopeptide repeat protein [bacterium]